MPLRPENEPSRRRPPLAAANGATLAAANGATLAAANGATPAAANGPTRPSINGATPAAAHDAASPSAHGAMPAGTAALAKGLRLLRIIAAERRAVRFAELMALSGLPKPTFSRILRTLVVHDLVQHGPERGAYTLGPAFLAMGQIAWETFDWRGAAGAELDRLQAETGESVAVCALDGEAALYLEVRLAEGLGVHVAPGRRVPLHATAAGKALVAHRPPGEREALIARLPLEAHGPATLSTPEALREALETTAARGFAVSREEHLAGVTAVAVPCLAPIGTAYAAFVALAPALRVDGPRERELAAILAAGAARASRRTEDAG